MIICKNLSRNFFPFFYYGLTLTWCLPISAKEITVATGIHPPFFNSEAGNRGIVLDIVDAAFQSVDLKVKFEYYPWARAEEYIRQDRIEASCCWFQRNDRYEYAIYSNPVFMESFYFFHLKSKKFEWEKLTDIEGKTIGAMLGSTYTEEFISHERAGTISVKRINSYINNFNKLIHGRIDAFLVDIDVGYYILSKNFNTEQISMVMHHPKPLLYNSIHVIFPNKNANSEKNVANFNKGLKNIIDNGTYNKILTNSKNKSKINHGISNEEKK